MLLAITIRRGDVRGDPVGRTQWWAAFVVGALLIAGGGSVVLAERTIPSGTVALIFALVPLWIALWDRIVGHRRLPPGSRSAWCSVRRRGAARRRREVRGLPLSGLLLAVAASVSWAAGSLGAQHAPAPHRPFVGNAMMMSGGSDLARVGDHAWRARARRPGPVLHAASVLALAT